MIALTNQNFDAEVIQSQTPVIVLWGGRGNVPANIMALSLKSFVKVAQKPPKLGRIDLNVSADLAMQFSIRNEPFLMLFVDGMALVAEDDLSTFIKGIEQWTS